MSKNTDAGPLMIETPLGPRAVAEAIRDHDVRVLWCRMHGWRRNATGGGSATWLTVARNMAAHAERELRVAIAARKAGRRP